MDGYVEQHAALARVVTPGAVLPQGRYALEHYRAQFAERARLDYLARADENFLKADLKSNSEGDPRRAARRGHFTGMLDRQGERLLAQHMLAGACRRQHHPVVIGVRRGDEYRFDIRRRRQLLDAGVTVLHAVSLRERARFLRRAARATDERRMR